jgi:hypothetical protein
LIEHARKSNRLTVVAASIGRNGIVMTPGTKPFPVNPTLELQRKLLLEPDSNPTRYVPFEHADAYPFEPDSTAASRVNAWWLAEASWLSYWKDQDALAHVLHDRAGLSCDAIAIKGAEGFVASCPRFAIIAFRGTQAHDWHDILDDGCYAPAPWDVGHVHIGFARRLETVRERLERRLNGLQSGCRVWFTGHSLGAAVATLAAYRYRRVAGGLYTFGSPLVGNDVFTSAFTGELGMRSVRYVNDHDVVTHVPPEVFSQPHGVYTHVDHLRWIDKSGEVGTKQPTLLHFVRDVFGRTNVVLDLIGLNRAGIHLSLPDALTDHTPLYYVLHCWNDFATHHPERSDQ